MRDTAAVHVSVVSDLDGFAALRPDWRALLERARIASVFLSWEWLHAWWRHYGEGHGLRLLVARLGDTVVGILPVYLQKTRVLRVVPVRTLRFVGTGGDTSPDDLDALLDPAHEAATARAFAEYVVREVGSWDVLFLTDMARDSAFRYALSEVAGLGSGAEGVSARISYLDLPESWEAYLEAQHRDRRYTLRQTRRRIEAQPGARLFVWEDAARLDQAVDRLVALHHLRWQERGEEHAFSTPQYVAFHREVMHSCEANGWLRLYCLEIGGNIVAMYYFYRFRNQVHYFQGGFDPALAKLRPGLVLMGYAIQHAIGEGNHVFDMLRGEYEYKTQWAKERRETYYHRAYRRSPAALAYRLRHDWLPGLKSKMKEMRTRTPSAAPAGRLAQPVDHA
jgi:CelD/BcsL family acetyltransferase involved in cellulose biosynthesis